MIYGVAYSTIFSWTIFNAWVLALNGVNYMHCSLISIIFSLLYLGLCVYFDDEIMHFCEKLGFV